MIRLIRAIRFIIGIPGKFLIWLVKFYQKAISPMFGPSCKFTPSCSSYMIQAIRKYGAIVGFTKGVWRICRCHPWSRGGEDPP